MMIFKHHLHLELYLGQLRATPPLLNITYIYDNVSYSISLYLLHLRLCWLLCHLFQYPYLISRWQCVAANTHLWGGRGIGQRWQAALNKFYRHVKLSSIREIWKGWGREEGTDLWFLGREERVLFQERWEKWMWIVRNWRFYLRR